MEPGTLVLDLGGVKKISSFGIREWVDFVTTSGTKASSLVLIECAPKVVDQLNMVANFAGGGKVFSFYAPFRCDYCDDDRRKLIQTDRDFESIKNKKLLPIAELDRGFVHPTAPSQVIVSYFQAGRICDFINDKFGWDTLLAMLHDFGAGFFVEAAYLGTKGTRLDVRILPNQLPPGSPLALTQRTQLGDAVGK